MIIGGVQQPEVLPLNLKELYGIASIVAEWDQAVDESRIERNAFPTPTPEHAIARSLVTLILPTV